MVAMVSIANSAELRCVRWDDGAVMWSHAGLGRSSVIYVDQHLICLTEEGRVLLFRATPDSDALVSELQLIVKDAEPRGFDTVLEYPAWAAPVLANGKLYLRGKGRVVCVKLLKG